MPKALDHPRTAFSKSGTGRLYRQTGWWLELDESGFYLAGPGGIWIGALVPPGLEVEEVNIRLAGGAQPRLILKSIQFKDLIPLAGDLNHWAGLETRNLNHINRHHPGWVEPNHWFKSSGYQKWQFNADSNQAIAEFWVSAQRIEIYFKRTLNLKPTTWRSLASSPQLEYEEWLMRAVLLRRPGWQDPRPWLYLVENFNHLFRASFVKKVYGRILTQWNKDWANPQVEELSPQFKSRSLLLSRQGWWLAHSEASLRLIKGLDHFSASAEIKQFQPLIKHLLKQISRNKPLLFNLDLLWFSNFLPLQNKIYSQTSSTEAKELISSALDTINKHQPIVSRYLTTGQVRRFSRDFQPHQASAARPKFTIAELIDLLYNTIR